SGYLVVTGVATTLVLGLALMLAVSPATPAVLTLVLLLFGLVPASELASGIANRVISASVVPKALPAMDFQAGVPANARTLVAMPAILTNAEAVDDLLSAIEVHYLSNSGPNVFFALLTDWR